MQLVNLPEVFDFNGRRVYKVRHGEAEILVACSFAEWRGRNKAAITTKIPVSSLIGFVHHMRHKPRPDTSGIDSRTYKYLGGNRGYKHVRNEAYLPANRQEWT